MQKNCEKCGQQFELTREDLEFLERISPIINGKKLQITEPTMCTNCRHQRRLAFRNERNLYKRECDLTGQQIVSLYAPESPHKVYSQDAYWSDKWDSLEYGRNYDFNRPFFEQFRELHLETPLISNIVLNSENCEYNAYCVDSKDCYMNSRVASEKVFYSYLAVNSYNCFDCFDIFDCNKCYECVDCWNCYNCKFSQICKNCSDCNFCFDCIGCKNCFGCVSLRNAQYHFFNKKYPKEEYEELVRKYELKSYKKLQEIKDEFHQFKSKLPMQATYIINSESKFGDYITNSKEVYNSFDVEQSETVRNSWGVEYAKSISDCNYIYYGENCYENISNSKSSNILFSFGAYEGVHNMLYSIQCANNTQDCFGCVSLKQKKYCILNKQYSKEEYEDLVPRIIEHMKSTGEWGEFFPISLSAFGYNKSLAMDHFPISKEDAGSLGANWTKETETEEGQESTTEIPDNIDDVTDDITKQALKCEISGKNYKIIDQELEFYRKNGLPIPRLSPNERYKKRLQMRNPKQLFNRNCAKCNTEIQTTYAPDRPETVYCEKCYLEAVY